MTKSGKLMRPDFVPVPPLTEKQKAAAFAHWGRRCTSKGCQETEGLEIDHLIARGLGGTNDLVNTRPMCAAHHSEKTHKKDRPAIYRAQRLNRAHFAPNEVPKKKKIPARGFGKSKRPLTSRSSWEKRK